MKIAKTVFLSVFGKEVLHALPPPELPGSGSKGIISGKLPPLLT